MIVIPPPNYDDAVHEGSDSEGEDEEIIKVEMADVRITDIFFGRGNGVATHPGNQNFRRIINAHKAEYRAAPRHCKMAVAAAVVDMIGKLDPPGRFLDPCVDGRFNIVDSNKALEKTSQALREKSRRIAPPVHPPTSMCHAAPDVDYPSSFYGPAGLRHSEGMHRFGEMFPGYYDYRSSSLYPPPYRDTSTPSAYHHQHPPPPVQVLRPIIAQPVFVPTTLFRMMTQGAASCHHRNIMALASSSVLLERTLQASDPCAHPLMNEPAPLVKPGLLVHQQSIGLGTKRSRHEEAVGRRLKRRFMASDDIEGQFDDANEQARPRSTPGSSSLEYYR